MKLLKYFILISILSSITFASCKQDSETSKKETKKETSIIDSEEFNSYFNKFFKLSDENTAKDLPYVNNFMKENKLFPFTDVCELLDKKEVIANDRVLKYWTVRCEFQQARNKLKRKYQIDDDSIKILIEEAIEDRK
jgi:hypothetical protein